MMKKFLKVQVFLPVVLLFSFIVETVLADRSLHESIWDEVKEKILLQRLPHK